MWEERKYRDFLGERRIIKSHLRKKRELIGSLSGVQLLSIIRC